MPAFSFKVHPFILLKFNLVLTDSSCRHVNCGGQDANIKENKQSVLYEGDGEVEGGTALYFFDGDRNWGFSSTGDFMDDNDYQNKLYTVSLPDANMDVLDTTARISPLSLTYFFYCLRNGQYTVRLQFAEIQFTTDNAFNSLGNRLFHIYIQVVPHVTVASCALYIFGVGHSS